MEGVGPVQAEVGGHLIEATEQVSADGHPHGDLVWISCHVPVLTPARWSPVTGVSRLERRASISSLRTALYRPRTAAGGDFNPNDGGGCLHHQLLGRPRIASAALARYGLEALRAESSPKITMEAHRNGVRRLWPWEGMFPINAEPSPPIS